MTQSIPAPTSTPATLSVPVLEFSKLLLGKSNIMKRPNRQANRCKDGRGSNAESKNAAETNDRKIAVVSEPPRNSPNAEHPLIGSIRHPGFYDLRLSGWINVVVGVALAVIGCLQYTVYEQQAAIMRIQNSAILTLHKIEGSWRLDENTRERIYIIWPVVKNSGSTVANVRFLYVNHYTPTTPIRADYEFPNLTFGGIRGNKGRAIIGPQVETRSHSIEISEADAENIQKHKRFFYVYGTILYQDQFSVDHVTMFCEQLESIQTNLAKEVPSFVFIPCERHNCMDGDCKDEPRASTQQPS